MFGNNNNNNNAKLDNDIDDLSKLTESGKDLQTNLDKFKDDITEMRLKESYNVNYSEPLLDEVNPDVTSSTSETYPWFYNEEPIDFNQSIKLFDGVKLVHNYLHTRRELDPNSLSNIQISE